MNSTEAANILAGMKMKGKYSYAPRKRARTNTATLMALKRQVAYSRPEMKIITYEYNYATATGGTDIADDVLQQISLCGGISEGTGVDERIGEKIRIWRVEVRGVSDVGLDHYLLQKHSVTGPIEADFTDEPGAFILSAATNSKFSEWKHYRSFNSTGALDALKFVQSFPTGLIVKYNGTTIHSNDLVFCSLNRFGSAQGVSCNIRVWYTDS